MDLDIFAALDRDALAAWASELLALLRLARELRASGSDVGASVIDLAVQFPPVSLVAFRGTVGIVLGYVPQSRCLAVGNPSTEVHLVSAGEATLVAYWGDLAPARIAQAYDATGEGIAFVCVTHHAPFTRVTLIEA